MKLELVPVEHLRLLSHYFEMLRSFGALGLLGFALFSSACDAGRSTPGAELPGDPSSEGSDEDLGADDGLSATPLELNGHLKVVGTQLQNEAGDAVQLKGVSSMWLNWESEGYAEDPTALRWMRNNWNLSVIRAAMGVEPPGAYLTDPDGAKQQVYTIVDNAIDAGVYVIVDFHDHAAHEKADDAVAFFSEVAAKYAGVPNVIYEPYNEPKGVGWEEVKAYHERVVAAIREQDAEAPIVLGTPNYSQDVDQAAADPVAGTNLLYTLHYYACSHRSWLRQKAEVAMARGVALFVTEFGATNADGGLDGVVCLDEAQLWNDWLKQRKISWTAWKLDDCEPDSTCLLKPGTPVGGGWTSEHLRGHALFVRGRMQE
jgi:aryl-phospho-beta-D-glucosidase BglC (GH1 family)